MTPEQKQVECLRICGERGQRGVHSRVPELCPILEDEDKRPTRNKEYGWANRPVKKGA